MLPEGQERAPNRDEKKMAEQMITCLDIGGSAIKAAVARSATAIEALARVRTPTEDFDGFVEAVRAMLAYSPAEAGSTVAIAITGVIDPKSGRMKCANIPCIDGRDLARELQMHLGRPVVIGNDADCFALAEAMAGAGRGHEIVFGAILGTGVGGGLVIGGKIITGPGGYAGEWGHAPVAATQAGQPPVLLPRLACGCGQMGCIDTLGGARGLERLHQQLRGERHNSVEIVAAWHAGEAHASRTIDIYMEVVAPPLALVINVVGAGIVPVGGGLGKAAGFVARLDTEVRKRILRTTDRPLLVQGELEGEPGLVGAALLGGMA